jgi:hypothetical protein
MKDIETIIKALETFPGGTTILYDSSNNETVTFQDVVDYVIQLQNENERLNDMEFTQEHCDLYSENEFLKAGLRDQKAEIERLTKDNQRLNELLVGGTEVIDYWNNKYLEEQAKNAELKKQVDELKREGARVVREKIPTRCDGCPFCLQRDHKDGTATIDWVCLANDTTRMPMATLHYTDTMHWKHDKCPLISVETVQQQAVKDTAKEIYQEIDKSDILVVKTQEYGEIEVVSLERLKEIVESKGVEVE